MSLFKRKTTTLTDATPYKEKTLTPQERLNSASAVSGYARDQIYRAAADLRDAASTAQTVAEDVADEQARLLIIEAHALDQSQRDLEVASRADLLLDRN